MLNLKFGNWHVCAKTRNLGILKVILQGDVSGQMVMFLIVHIGHMKHVMMISWGVWQLDLILASLMQKTCKWSKVGMDFEKMAQTDFCRCLDTLKISLERYMEPGLRHLAIGIGIYRFYAIFQQQILTLPTVVTHHFRLVYTLVWGILRQVWILVILVV